MKTSQRALALVLISILSTVVSCTHLQSVSTSSVPSDRSKPVKAESYKFIFLAFNFNNDYVEEMTDGLSRQCPNGQIKGILTKFENIVYFPLFAHAVQVKASGYCVGAK